MTPVALVAPKDCGFATFRTGQLGNGPPRSVLRALQNQSALGRSCGRAHAGLQRRVLTSGEKCRAERVPACAVRDLWGLTASFLFPTWSPSPGRLHQDEGPDVL